MRSAHLLWRNHCAVHRHPCSSRTAHTQLFGGRFTQINDETFGKWPSVIDAHQHLAAIVLIHDPHRSADRQCQMRCRVPMPVKSLATGRTANMPTLAAIPRCQPLSSNTSGPFDNNAEGLAASTAPACADTAFTSETSSDATPVAADMPHHKARANAKTLNGFSAPTEHPAWRHSGSWCRSAAKARRHG